MGNRQELRIEKITETISQIPNVEVIKPFTSIYSYLFGEVAVYFQNLENPLCFEVRIMPHYPFRMQGDESIKFINKDLVTYSHVMGDGSICINTSQSHDLKKKLQIDFRSLIEWIDKYYINEEKDKYYEHIIVPPSELNGNKFSYFFTQIKNELQYGDFGLVNILQLGNGIIRKKICYNFLLQKLSFKNRNNQIYFEWGKDVMNMQGREEGIFYFLDTPPAIHGKFAFNNWIDLKEMFSGQFLNFLHLIEKNIKYKGNDAIPIPLFLGYRIPNGEIYWQTAIIKPNDFPIKGTPVSIDGRKTGEWQSTLIEKEILWGVSKDCSYNYFFGRGRFSGKITKKKILVLGLGAIGSIVAKTLVKCGCTRIDISDFDIKEPENVCRSEYVFSTGIIDKVEELAGVLTINSPFLETKILDASLFEYYSKFVAGDGFMSENIEGILNQYDLIFDCTTDNDLMYVLDSLKNLKAKIVNLSITNKATSLVCAFSPNIYQFVTIQFQSILDNDTSELYEPTGCWSPTFKASYNDINNLVQNAMRVINKKIESEEELRNFVLYYENDFDIKYSEY